MNEFERERRRHNLTQGQIARFLGVSRNTVYRWETGDSKPSRDKQQKLEELYAFCEEETYTEIGEIRSLSAKTSAHVVYEKQPAKISLTKRECAYLKKNTILLVTFFTLSLLLLLFCGRCSYVVAFRFSYRDVADRYIPFESLLHLYNVWTLVVGFVLLLASLYTCIYLLIKRRKHKEDSKTIQSYL